MRDRRLEKAVTDLRDGGLDAAVAYFTENNTPNLILVESALSGEELLAGVGSLADVCDEGTEVVVLGAVNDVETYRILVQEGVSDYLVAPFSPTQVFATIEAIAIDPNAPPRGRVIAFMGSSGGSGSSTIAHNTAWSLAQIYDDDVFVLDLDIAFGTLGLAYNAETEQGIQDCLAAGDRLDEMLMQRYIARPADHILLLTSPASLELPAEIDVEAFDFLLEMVRQTAPFIVLDIPHGWSAWIQHVLMQADEIVLTSQLDLAALRDCKNFTDLMRIKRVNDAPVRLALNHVGAYRKTELTEADFESAIGILPSLALPHDPVLFGTAANNGQMIGAMSGRNKIVDGFEELAKEVSGMEPPKKEVKRFSLFSFLKKGKDK